jgi:hypothetical protein
MRTSSITVYTPNIKESAESDILFEFLYVILYTLLLLSKKEKEKLVIELVNEGKTTREIAKAVHISLKDIGRIIHKVTGDDESLAEKEREKTRNKRGLNLYRHMLRPFKCSKITVTCSCGH